MAFPLDGTDAIAKLAAGTHVLMPAKADGEMLRAIWNYYSTRLKYQDRKDDTQIKADCWMALMAYDAMVDLFKGSAPQVDQRPGASSSVSGDVEGNSTPAGAEPQSRIRTAAKQAGCCIRFMDHPYSGKCDDCPILHTHN